MPLSYFLFTRPHLLYRRCLSLFCLLGIGLGAVMLKSNPAQSAEEVKVTYGLLEFSLSIESLEIYAESGEMTDEFRFYARRLDDESLLELRRILQRRFEVNPVIVSQIAYSEIGESVLQQFGEIVRTDANLNGFYALRAAFLLAASDPEGASMINILRYYPSPSIRIEAQQIFRLERLFNEQVDYQNAAVEAIEQESDAEAAATVATGIDFSQVPDPRLPGSFTVTHRTLELSRDRRLLNGQSLTREFSVDLYLPEELTQPAPVIVISHGLGSSPSAFAYLGEHLASHGFAVVIPQHIGSDSERREAILTDILTTPISPVEFLDRPVDISFTLDELEKLSETDPTLAGRLNIQQVGVIGHSFGGYTALALAGATINHARLSETCDRDELTLNASPFLQCLAASLPDFTYYLRDSRVKATIAISPLTSTVFGPEGMSQVKTPTLMIGGSRDLVTSVVQEQIHPFFWLTNPDKYLALFVPSGHTYADNTVSDLNPIAQQVADFLSGPDPLLAREYLSALSVAFMQTHLQERSDYAPLLSAAYTQSIRREPLQLEFVETLTPEQLETAYGGTPPIAAVPEPVSEVVSRSSSVQEEIVETGVLRATVRDDVSPFSYRDPQGEWSGYCVDLLGALADQLEQQFETPIALELSTSSLSDNPYQSIQDGTAQISCGTDTIQNNIPGVEFSTPFFLTGTHFLVRAEDADSVNPLLQLQDVTIGVLDETSSEQFVRERYPDARVVQFSGSTGRTEGVQALTQGTLDAFAGDGVFLLMEANRQDLPSDRYRLLPDGPLTCDPYGMLLPAGDRTWQATVNDFVASEQAAQIWGQWFRQDLSYLFLNLEYCVD